MTVLAYGQIGSGKTHTMFGKDWQDHEILSSQNKARTSNSSRIQYDEKNEAGLI